MAPYKEGCQVVPILIKAAAAGRERNAVCQVRGRGEGRVGEG